MFFQISNSLAKLKASAFVKNVIVVMSGTALAQAISFALSPVISRLYSPGDFGVFGSFAAILGVVAAGMTLDYSQALMLPREKRIAFDLFVISSISSFIIAAICLIICLINPGFIVSFMKAPNAWILALLVCGVLVAGLNQTFQGWCIRAKSFKKTSGSQVLRSLSTNGIQIGFGNTRAGALALVFAVVIGDLAATLSLAKGTIQDLRSMWTGIRWKQLWEVAKEYRDFPLYSASTNVINALSLGLPIFCLTHFYGIATAGAYAFGIRLMQAPMELVLKALRQVLYQKASETYNRGGRLVPLYIKITGSLFAIGFLPSLFVFNWAPQIFSWIFGSQWHTAGVFVRYLVLWLFFLFCNVPAVLFTRIIRIQRKMFFFNLILLITRALALIVGGVHLSASQTVLLYSLAGAVLNVIYIIMIGFVLMKLERDTDLRDVLDPCAGPRP